MPVGDVEHGCECVASDAVKFALLREQYGVGADCEQHEEQRGKESSCTSGPESGTVELPLVTDLVEDKRGDEKP